MTVIAGSDAEIHDASKSLRYAVNEHARWIETFHTALICHTAPRAEDLAPDAHRHCPFGAWYYGPEARIFRQHPAFIRIESAHEDVHRLAADMLRNAGPEQIITVVEYERVIKAMRILRGETAALTREIQAALYDLDPLTGTPGRTGMLAKLGGERALVARGGKHCAIAMMDLDEFKAVNDTYGHLVGDRVLQAFARYVMAHLRPYDRIFRYGGEEFLICLPDAELEKATEIMDRLRQGLGAIEHSEAGRTFTVTVSMGLALLDPDVEIDQSIERADKALYAAKSGGRNRVMTWKPEMGAAG